MSNQNETRQHLKRAMEELGDLSTSGIIWQNVDQKLFTQSLDPNNLAFEEIESAMQSSIKRHKGNMGGVFKSYQVVKIERVISQSMIDRYNSCRREVSRDTHGHLGESMLFHGSPKCKKIAENGFSKSETNPAGMFGGGFYFTDVSSKANQYSLAPGGCQHHGDKSCYSCPRQLLLCRVIIGRSRILTEGSKYDTAPSGYHSVSGKPSNDGLKHWEYVVYKAKQIYPELIITYKIQQY